MCNSNNKAKEAMPLRGSMGMGGIGGRKEKGGSDVIMLNYFFLKKLTSTLIMCMVLKFS